MNRPAKDKEGRSIRVAVLGLGYVGLPLSIEFARGGLQVVGIDVSRAKVDQLRSGVSHVLDVPAAVVREFIESGRIEVTTDFAALERADAVCICVPTPLRKSMDPDISYIVDAVEQVRTYLHRGMLIVLESTSYPGTTEELVLPRLSDPLPGAESGLVVGVDFFLAFSPERVDPGNSTYTTRNTPKVIGGVTERCTEKAVELYRHAVDTLVPVKSARAAEMVKLLENTFRAINIGMVNELALICDRLGVDVWEVIDAAKTKPFGFMPFYPGPGLGGHCIPIDPLYLSWKLKTINYTARFIELATSINSSMPEYVLGKIANALNDAGKCLNGSRILLLGVAYKKDVSDTRESPALDIMGLLETKGAQIEYSDPYVPSLEVLGRTFTSYDLREGVSQFDCTVVVTDHTAFDYRAIVRQASLLVDARNATAGIPIPQTCRVVKL